MTIVMKFGGSLLASRRGIQRVGDLVVRTHRAGNEVIAVVSALGDVTDILLQAANDARGWSEEEIQEAVEMGRRAGARVLMAISEKSGGLMAAEKEQKGK